LFCPPLSGLIGFIFSVFFAFFLITMSDVGIMVAANTVCNAETDNAGKDCENPYRRHPRMIARDLIEPIARSITDNAPGGCAKPRAFLGSG
jgi:hypothetical protein